MYFEMERSEKTSKIVILVIDRGITYYWGSNLYIIYICTWNGDSSPLITCIPPSDFLRSWVLPDPAFGESTSVIPILGVLLPLSDLSRITDNGISVFLRWVFRVLWIYLLREWTISEAYLKKRPTINESLYIYIVRALFTLGQVVTLWNPNAHQY